MTGITALVALGTALLCGTAIYVVARALSAILTMARTIMAGWAVLSQEQERLAADARSSFQAVREMAHSLAAQATDFTTEQTHAIEAVRLSYTQLLDGYAQLEDHHARTAEVVRQAARSYGPNGSLD